MFCGPDFGGNAGLVMLGLVIKLNKICPVFQDLRTLDAFLYLRLYNCTCKTVPVMIDVEINKDF